MTQEQLQIVESELRRYYNEHPEPSSDLDDEESSRLRTLYIDISPPVSEDEWILTEKEWIRMYNFFQPIKTGDTLYNPIGFMMYRKKPNDQVAAVRAQIRSIINKIKDGV